MREEKLSDFSSISSLKSTGQSNHITWYLDFENFVSVSERVLEKEKKVKATLQVLTHNLSWTWQSLSAMAFIGIYLPGIVGRLIFPEDLAGEIVSTSLPCMLNTNCSPSENSCLKIDTVLQYLLYGTHLNRSWERVE